MDNYNPVDICLDIKIKLNYVSPRSDNYNFNLKNSLSILYVSRTSLMGPEVPNKTQMFKN